MKQPTPQKRGKVSLNTVALLIVVFMSLLNFALVRSALPVLSSIGPRGNDGQPGQSIKGGKGDSPTREELLDLIRPLIPKVKDGKDGKDGQNGLSIIGPQGPEGPQGNTGEPGEPGAPAREIELRHNDVENRTEWRYVGELNWQVLMNDCEITNTCLP